MANNLEPWGMPNQLAQEANRRAPATIGLGIPGGIIGAVIAGPPGALVGFIAAGFLGLIIDQEQQTS